MLSLLPGSTEAADRTWKNISGNTDWNTASNWITAAPSGNDQAIFINAAIANPNLSSSASFNKIVFRAADAVAGITDGAGYTLSGSSGTSLTLTSAVAQGTIEGRNTSGVNTVSVNLILGAAAGAKPLFVQNAGGTLVVSGNVSSTNALESLTLSNNGVITLSGSNTYAGNTILSGAGITNINHASAVSAGDLIIHGGIVSNTSGAAITLTHNNNIIGNSNVVFTSAAGTGDLSFGSGVFKANGGDRSVVVTNAGSTLTVGSLDADTTTRKIITGTNTSAGRLLVTGAAGQNYAGTVSLLGGVLEIGNKNALGTGTLEWQSHATPGTTTFQTSVEMTGTNAVANALKLGSGANSVGTAIIGGSNSIEFSGVFTSGLAASRTLTINNTGTTTFSGRFNLGEDGQGRTLVLNGTGDTEISGVIANNTANNGAGGGKLTYAGSGTLRLSGSNIYTGATTVSSGTLLVDGRIANGAVTVASGAILGGKGTVGGATTVNGTLRAGTTLGNLTFSGNLSLNTGATYRFEGGDPTVVNGTLSLNDNWTLTLSGDQFVNGGSIVLFTFGSLAANPDFSPNFDVSLLGINLTGPLSLSRVDNTIVLNGITAVPEPAPLGLVIAGLAAAMVLGRRARSLRIRAV